MRRYSLAILILAALVVPAWSLAQQAAQQPQAAAAQRTPGPAPVIDIAEKIKDFGVVPKGEKLKAVFEVKNTGNAPLEITQVRPTCGCTVADKPTQPIPPGGTGKVVAEVDTKDFSGPISKAVLVFSNDPANPNINLVIKAEVRSFIDVLPRPQVFFRGVLQGEEAKEKLKLVSSDGSDFKILSVDNGGGPFVTSFRELPEADRVADRKGQQWEVTIGVPASAAEGLLNYKVAVKTSSPKAPEVTINVSGAIRPIIQVIPAEVNFGKVGNDTLIGHNILLINNRPSFELKLGDLKIDDPEITTDVITLQPGQRYQVAISLKAGATKGEHKTVLRIGTNDALRKLIEVPVQATVQ
jgi:Protein of unknown function (DUF1573)